MVGPTRTVDKEDLAKLKYMERFIKETLRLFPVAGFVVRAVDEDIDIGEIANLPMIFANAEIFR